MSYARIAALALGIALAAGPALAANEGNAGKANNVTTMTTAGSPDKAFMVKAAQGGLAEVALGDLAQKNGGTAGKAFGEHMVRDHSKANTSLKALAAKLGVTLPTQPTTQQQAQMQTLRNLKGASFDRAYLEMMHVDHVKDIAEFKREASSGKDKVVRAWAAQTLPTLEHHLAMNQHYLAGLPKVGGGAGH